VILHFADTCLPGAIGATIKSILGLDTMSDDLAAAVIADGRKFMDCTLETVEGMTSTGRHHLEGQVIIVTAHFTFRHQHNLSVALPRTPIHGFVCSSFRETEIVFPAGAGVSTMRHKEIVLCGIH